jgi:arabinan endo-1,5-alpha-L-arabinosidase
MKIPARRAVLAVVSAVAATLFAGGGASASLGSDAGPAGSASLAGPGVPADYVFVHDPSMAREGGTYYLFSTGDPAGVIGNGNIQIRTSRDLRHWTYEGTVFAAKPAWTPPRWAASRTCGPRTSPTSAGCGTCTTRGPASARTTR